MDFFSKTKESLMNVGTAFTQKASDVSGAAVLAMKIHDQEKAIQNGIAELGKRMLEQHPDEARTLCPELYTNILEMQKQLEKDRKELAVCRGMKICPNCGAEQQAEAVCCTACGINMQEAEVLLAQAQPVCKNCGALLPEGCAFCSNCGTKVE